MNRFALFSLGIASLATTSWIFAPDSLTRVIWNAPGARAAPHETHAAPIAVQPGLVRWRASFDEACDAARTSGKPVMLFQMLGRLDEELC